MTLVTAAAPIAANLSNLIGLVVIAGVLLATMRGGRKARRATTDYNDRGLSAVRASRTLPVFKVPAGSNNRT
jgi:hypothetical protein